MPDATVSGDFIVGCPGESDEAFERTLDLMDAVVFDACMTAAFSPRPGTPMAHWDGASEAFGVLGVDLWRLKSVDEARTAVHAQFKALAKSQLTVMHNGVHDETWDDVVVAKRAALDALDRADAAPPSAFHPLSGVGPAQVPDDVKEKRLYRMKDRADAHALARSQRYAGRTEAVLVESRNTRVPTQVVGRTRGNKLVFFEGAAEELVGRTVDVRILNASTFSLIGERVS
jgi:tRNA A37 methylthiotransferase MiaB